MLQEGGDGYGVSLQLVERGTELSLLVSVAGHDFDPNTAETDPIDPDGLAVLIANLVRPYIYQYPGAEGRALVNKVKARLEDVLRGH